MSPSKRRSESSEMALSTSPPSSNSKSFPSKSMPISYETDTKAHRYLQRSSSAKITAMAEKRVARGLEIQQQLSQAHEDLKKANDHLELAEQEKSRILDELKEMKKVAEDANLRLSEALLAHKQAHESCEIEKARVKDLEQASIESAQKRDQAWQLELEASQKQHALDVQALSFAVKEIERINQGLSLAIRERNKALKGADDARIAAEANAKMVKFLSSELNSLKDSPKTDNVSQLVAEKKLSNSNVEMESSKANELLVRTSSIVDPRKFDVETELVERASLIERLELELRNARECESQAMGFLSESKIRIEILAMEQKKAKVSEAKMLESLISQTKQFEETKISLEEAKLEIASLYENIGSLSNSMAPDGSHQHLKIGELAEIVKMLESELQMTKEDLIRTKEREELALTNSSSLTEAMSLLKNELKLAMEAEEKSKMAMDGLALALKEVTTEASQVIEKLASAQSELENVKMEAKHLKLVVRSREDKYQALLDEARRETDRYKEAVEIMKLEAEELTTSWNTKEVGLVHYVKKSEEEITSTKEENRKLIESLRDAEEEVEMAQVEIRNLRDIVKQAVNEATVAKEAAEITRIENSQLKDDLLDMDSKLESIAKENELLKMKVNSAFGNVKELKSLHATAPTSTSSKNDSSLATKGVEAKKPRALKKANAVDKEDKDRKEVMKLSSEQSKKQHFLDLKLENVQHRHNVAAVDSGVLERSLCDLVVSREHDSISRQKSSTFVISDVGQTIKLDDFDHIEGQIDDFESDGSSATRQRKKKALLQRFGSLMRKKNC